MSLINTESVAIKKAAVLNLLDNAIAGLGRETPPSLIDVGLTTVLTIETLFEHDADIADAAFAARSKIEALREADYWVRP